MKLRSLFLLVSMVTASVCFAQYDAKVNVEVTAVDGGDLSGLEFSLYHVGYSLNYSGTVLDGDGKCSLDVISGEHRITIEKPGYAEYVKTFTVASGETKELDIVLQDDVREPFALKADLQHDIFTGKDDVFLSWNKEEPSFFDDFESYEDFAIQFGDWTGIDGDQLAAAPIQGDYPNRGALQYAQIINPLTVEPAWWYDYPVLRPYSGKQYVGFVRTSIGRANDDWLISPSIEVKEDNILRFMAKAADRYPERFEVGITTVDNPEESDFEIISSGNYETVSYEQWVAKVYDLSEYQGQTVKIGIHYISDTNRYGAFMLMVDDFYVGQREYGEAQAMKARRVPQHSPANPNESFKIYKNGEEVGTTDGYSYLLTDLQPGDYKFGVKAVYKSGVESEMSEVNLNVPSEGYSAVTFNVSTNNKVSADGLAVSLVSVDTSDQYSVTVAGGKASVPSLPDGVYMAAVVSDEYEDWSQELTVNGDVEIPVALKERIYTPYNITTDVTEGEDGNYNVAVKWNQDLGFSDSFEDYEDFAQGSFGDWLSIDVDQMPAMPISLQGVQVTFPGASTSTNPVAIAPIIMNPYMTTPALALDGWFLTGDGDKYVAFFSPWASELDPGQADKWLISPELSVYENYVLRFSAVGYDWPETLEICVSTTDTEIGSFVVLDEINTDIGGNWTQYEVDLSAYEGQKVYVGIHCISYAGWVCMFDDFYVGPAEEGAAANVGNVLSYEVFLDGVSQGMTQTASFNLTDVAPGTHTVGIEAHYESGVSERAEYEFTAGLGSVEDTSLDSGTVVYGADGALHIDAVSVGTAYIYNVAGQLISNMTVEAGSNEWAVPAGLYIVKFNGDVYKVAVK